jgi:hypothetical protein
MKYVVGIGSGSMIYKPSFKRIGSHSKVDAGERRDAHTNRHSLMISLAYFKFSKIKNVDSKPCLELGYLNRHSDELRAGQTLSIFSKET